ncbi:MAG: Plug domain-containing protein [Gemmatimonadota bacterium]|nr:Plug domain-containing protein [Gemmatimonadota bacterium]
MALRRLRVTLSDARSATAFALTLMCAASAVAGAQAGTRDTLPTPAEDAAPKAQRKDSIQARIGRDAVTPSLEIGQSFTYDRDQLFASGAITLGDLLDRIPAFTTFRTGWLAAPQAAAVGGDFSRVRIFIDGIERDDLEPRNGVAPDLSTVPIWMLQTLSLARSANELRVDLRTWEYDGTAPYTRIDALTGDLNTNLYRAFYGKRFYNGAALQVALQQFGVTDARNGGGGQDFGGMVRYGIGRPNWSLDVTATRANDSRIVTSRYLFGQAMPGYRAASTLAYIRAAIGREGSGPFLQLVASTQILKESSPHYDSLTARQYGFASDTVDSLASVAQYIATAGFDAGGGRLRLIERYRTRLGKAYSSPSATFDLTNAWFSANAMAERDGYAGLTRVEAGARLTPLPFIAVLGYVGQRSPFGLPAPGFLAQPTSRSARVEAGLRIVPAGLWLTAGVVTRDTAVLVPSALWDTAFVAVPVGSQTGTTVGLHGPVGRGFSIDATAIQWKQLYPYTPKTEAHADVRFYTEWLSRFPTGNFSFLFQPGIDYRTAAPFPESGGNRLAMPSRAVSLLVELRILRGVLSFQRRNLLGAIYDQVPGYLMPRPVNVYGVRWYFFN